jgi:uncharacterized protein YhfF
MGTESMPDEVGEPVVGDVDQDDDVDPTGEIRAFWEMARRHARIGRPDVVTGASVGSDRVPTVRSFGDDAALSDELCELVLVGAKTATARSLAEIEAAGEPLPKKGDLSIVLDGAGNPRALIRTVNVVAMGFRAVAEDVAAVEGEDDRTLEKRYEHETSCRRVLEASWMDLSPDLQGALETFEVLYPKQQDR